MLGKLIPMRWIDGVIGKSSSRDSIIAAPNDPYGVHPVSRTDTVSLGKRWTGEFSAFVDELERQPAEVRDAVAEQMAEFLKRNDTMNANADGSRSTGATPYSAGSVGDRLTVNRYGKVGTITRPRMTDGARLARDTTATVAGMNERNASFWEEHNRALNGRR